MSEACQACGGSGMRLVERADGSRAAANCECRLKNRFETLLARARIPERYTHCTLDDYVPNYDGKNQSFSTALLQAHGFVKAYPIDTNGNGLLLTGSIGVGKTHLAVGMLRGLITERGAKGVFYDYRDLLKRLQNSYNRHVEETELQILKPVFEAEVLVLDELGATKPTEWVWDTVAHVLNTRYNDRRTTIITTNYANLAPGGISESGVRTTVREETLGDRIGERMRSRLQEMCAVVEMHGHDFRQSVKRAGFA